jgi:cysteine-rich repeat protein
MACYSPNEPLDAGGGDSSGTSATESDGSSGIATTAGESSSASGMTVTGMTGSADSSSEASSTGGAPVCGDGMVDGDEACDDGLNDGSYGGCAPDCAGLAPHCGDGVAQAEEVCDDGNAVDADGCNIDCIESASTIWTRTFPGVQAATAYAVATGPEDAIAITGSEISGGQERVWIRRYEADGDEDWTETYSEPGSTRGYGVAIDADGSVYACGDDGWSRKYDLGSALVYANDYEASVGAVTAIAAAADGYVAVAGEIAAGAPNGGDIWVRRLDGDGEEMWTETVHAGSSDAANGVAVDSSGSILVAGSTNASGSDAWLRKYSSEGAASWTRTYNGGGTDLGLAVAVGPEDRVAVAGRSSLLGSDAIWVRVYDDAGVEQWTETFESGFPSSADAAFGVAVDAAGNIVAVGEVQTSDADVSQAWVRKYSPAGVPLWTLQWNIVEPTTDAETSARGVAIDGTSNIVVVGFEVDSDGAYSAWIRKLAP